MTVKTLTQVVNGRLEPTASQLDADLIEVSKISGNQIQIKEDGLFVPYSSGGGGSLPFSVVDWDVKSIDATPIGFTTSEGATYVDGVLSIDPATLKELITTENIPEGLVYSEGTLVKETETDAMITFSNLSSFRLSFEGASNFSLSIYKDKGFVSTLLFEYDGSILTVTPLGEESKVFQPTTDFSVIILNNYINIISSLDVWNKDAAVGVGASIDLVFSTDTTYLNPITIYTYKSLNIISNNYERVPTSGTVLVKKPVNSFCVFSVGLHDSIFESGPEDFLLYFYNGGLITSTGIQIEEIWNGRVEISVFVKYNGIEIDGVLYEYPSLNSLRKLQILSFSGSDANANPIEFTTSSFDIEIPKPTELPANALDGQIYRIINDGIYSTYNLTEGDFVTFYNNLSEIIFTRNIDQLIEFIETKVVEPINSSIYTLEFKTKNLEEGLNSKANSEDVRSTFKGRVSNLSELPRYGSEVREGDYAILGVDPAVQNEMHVFSGGTWSPLRVTNYSTDIIPEGFSNKYFTAYNYLEMARMYYNSFDEEFKSVLDRLSEPTTVLNNDLFGISHTSYEDTVLVKTKAKKIEVVNQPNTELSFKTKHFTLSSGGFRPTEDILGDSTGIAVYGLNSLQTPYSNSWIARFYANLGSSDVTGTMEIGLCELHNNEVSNRCYFLIKDGSLSLYYNDTKIELNTYSVAYDKEQLIIQRDRDKFYLYGTGAYDPYPPIRIKVPIEGYTNWSNINIYVKYHGNTNGYFLNRAEVQLQLTNVNR